MIQTSLLGHSNDILKEVVNLGMRWKTWLIGSCARGIKMHKKLETWKIKNKKNLLVFYG